MNDDGCSSCHLLNEGEIGSVSLSGDTFTSSFANMDLQTCTQCHQTGRAPDTCLTCHNYHVEPFTESAIEIDDSIKSETEDE